MKITPTDASKVRNMLSSDPPTAVTAPPRPNARAEIFGTSMPTKPEASGLTDTARNVRPSRVRFSQKYRIQQKKMAKRTHRAFAGT